MARYPRVYVDTSPMSQAPYEVVIAALRRLIEAGYADRVMFGSDYRGGFARSVEVIATAEFLSDAQKRGIFYDNALKFLGPRAQ